MKGISVVVIVLFFLLGMIFLIFENKQRKMIAQHKMTLNLMIDDSKHRYKLDVETLCEELFLSRDHRDKLYIIANNWFVYQPITEANVDNLTITLKRLSLSFGTLVAHFTEDNENIDFAQERVNNFVNSLPTDTNGFNADFYNSKIERLWKLLDVPQPQSTDIDEELPFVESSVSTDFANNSQDEISSYNSGSFEKTETSTSMSETSTNMPEATIEDSSEKQEDAVI